MAAFFIWRNKNDGFLPLFRMNKLTGIQQFDKRSGIVQRYGPESATPGPQVSIRLRFHCILMD